MCKPIDFNRPVQVRRLDNPYHKNEVRAALVLNSAFIHQRGNECALIQFKCSDGSDTVQVFDKTTGEFVHALHNAVRGFTLENVPMKKKFYLYEDTRFNGEVTYTMRNCVRDGGKASGCIGVMKWRLLKEVEVEL